MDELKQYLKLSKDSVKVKEVIEAFLRNSIEREEAGFKRASEVESAELVKLAAAAKEMRSVDPIYLSHAAKQSQREGDFKAAVEFGNQSIEKFDEQNDYPAGMRYILVSRFIRLNISDGSFVNSWRGLALFFDGGRGCL